MENSPKQITIFGGSGFLGRHVVGALAKEGHRIIVAVRRPDLAFHLQPLGDLGQIKMIQANIRVPWTIDRAVKNSDVIINLVGTFDAGGKNNFKAVQSFGANAIAKAAKNIGAQLIHVSALGANEHSPSAYGRSKCQGEKFVLDTVRSAIVMRPSVIFGPEDDFFNRFAKMTVMSPLLPIIGGGKTKFQPVYVGDVAKAIVLGVEGKLKAGKVYELGGADILSFRQCLDLMLEITDRSSGYLSLPWFAAKSIAKLTGWIPGAPLTIDQVYMLETDNIVSPEAIKQKRTLEGIGINPTSLEAILPSYLVRFRPHGQFSRKGEA